jgi:hypothetical protein
MFLARTDEWYLERVLYFMAGVFTLIGVAFAYFFSPYWLILNLLVGLNLTVYSLTGFCVMAIALDKFGIKTKCSLNR